MKPPIMEQVKIQTIRAALLALIVYMVDRAVTALVYPGESEILRNAEQSQFKVLQLFQLEHLTNYITNSILFPLLLVVLYKVADLKLGKWVVMVLALHYASVLAVSVYHGYQANIEYTEYRSGADFYEDRDGHIYHESELSNDYYGRFSQDHDGAFTITYSDGSTAPLVQADYRFSLKAFLYFFYSLIMSSILLLLGAVCLPVIFRAQFFSAGSGDTSAIESEDH